MTGVVTALSHRWEAVVAATLEPVPGVTVLRRCADVAELVSVAAAGLGECAVVSADLRGLDLSVVDHLRRRGIWVVGLYPAGEDGAERRLRQLLVDIVLPVEAIAEQLARAVDGRTRTELPAGLEEPVAPGEDPPSSDATPAGAAAGKTGRGGSGPPAWSPAGSRAEPGDLRQGLAEPRSDGVRQGRILAVWGPNGAPGRTTIAVTLAAELAGRGRSVLLVDADTYGGCVAQVLGLLDEAPGLAAACRAAEHGSFDLAILAGLAPEVSPGLRVLTGLPRAERWPEIRTAALTRVLEVSRALATHVIIDCGFCLEEDEELSYDTQAPRRNEATLTSLAVSDEVIAVGGADPVALQRFVRGIQQLGTVPSPPAHPVINRVRATAVGPDPRARIGASLGRFAGLTDVRYVPDDPEVADAALLAGRSVVEHAPESALRRAVADLATALSPGSVTRASRRVRWRSRGRLRAAVRG